jgi:hypothetical protein
VDRGNFVGTRSVSWYSAGTSVPAADLATIKLDRAATDAFIFRVRSSRVPLGTNLGMVGYPLGNRLSLNQGKVIWRGRFNGAPLLAVRMLGAEGASGSPFIDDQGRVVGILQVGLGSKDVLGQRTSGVLEGLDLVRWWGPRARLDLCRAYPKGEIPGCSGAGAAPAGCAANDRSYLNKLTRPYSTYVARWNAWIDSGQPSDESFRPTFTALYNLWLGNPDDLACSPGVKKVASLIGHLLPLLDQIGALLDSLEALPIDDPTRAGIESQLEAATTPALYARLTGIDDQLKLVGYYK